MAKILVVDDTEADLHVLQEILTAEGHDIFTASSGKQALERFRTHNPDLVITDVNMPLMDGFELAKEIRKVALHTPVIFTSAVYRDVASKAGPMEEGINDYLAKPLDFDELKYKVSVMMERKKAEIRLNESEEKARAVIDASMDAIIVIDGKGVVSFFNTAAEKIFGYMPEEIIGKKLHDILVSDRARGQYNVKLPKFEITGLCEVVGKTLEVTAVQKDGTPFPVEMSISSFNIRGEWHSLGTVRDITERKRMEDRLREAAITDDLTGLFNRRGFFTVAEQQRKFAVRNKRRLALLYLDLNNMKDINDRFGHAEGDRALRDTAGILSKAFRESDICARIGGDEFVVLLTDHAGSDNEHIIKNQIEDRLTERNSQSDRPFELSLSLGMAHFDPGMPCSVAELLTRADASMYESKKQYKNNRSLWPGGYEKRRHERHKVAGKYWAEIPGSGSLEIKNISINGLCIRTSRQLPANSIHDISILPSGNGGITPNCRVIWSLPVEEDDGSGKTFYETGFRIIELTDEMNYLLDEFITGLNR